MSESRIMGYKQIGLDLPALLFSLWTRQTHKLVCVFSSPYVALFPGPDDGALEWG